MTLPLTMGHETVGEVVAFGPDARDVSVGDRRLVYPWIGCGTCKVCRRGEEQLCTQARFPRRAPSGRLQRPCRGAAPALPRRVRRHPARAGSAARLLRRDPYGALRKLGGLVQTEPVVIIGAGGVGLMCLAILKALGGFGAIVVGHRRPAPRCGEGSRCARGRRPECAGRLAADNRGGRRRRMGGGRLRRLVRHGAARLRRHHQGRQDHRGRAVRRRDHHFDAVHSDQGDDPAGLLYGKPDRAQGADRSHAHRAAAADPGAPAARWRRPTRRSPTSRKARLSAAPCCRPVDHPPPRCARRPAASAGLSAGPPSGWSR